MLLKPAEGHSKLGKKNSTAIPTELWLQQQLQHHHHNTLFPSHHHHHQHHRYWALYFFFFFFFCCCCCCCVCLSFYLSPHVCLWSNFLSFQKTSFRECSAADLPISVGKTKTPSLSFFLSYLEIAIIPSDLLISTFLTDYYLGQTKKTHQRIYWIQ